METRFIAYLRTSTPHPYSLEVQRQTIEGYAARIGGTIIARFEEVRLARLSRLRKFGFTAGPRYDPMAGVS
jgi:hypothetical protein